VIPRSPSRRSFLRWTILFISGLRALPNGVLRTF
jgi:hypothetical protein